MSAPVIEAKMLSVRRGTRLAVNQVSAGFYKGVWTTIVGPNGAGKSTLVSALAGLLSTHSGEIHLDSKSLRHWTLKERAHRMTWLGQSGATEGDLAAHEIVRLGRLPRYGLLGAPTTTDEHAITAALEETEATDFADRRLRELSGGERQRVLLARAFAAHTPILLMDEPTVHLDAPHQRRLIQSFKRRALAGCSVISVLHDLTLALAADRLLVMADGRVHADGAPEDPEVQKILMRVFDHAFTIESIGHGAERRLAAVPLF